MPVSAADWTKHLSVSSACPPPRRGPGSAGAAAKGAEAAAGGRYRYRGVREGWRGTAGRGLPGRAPPTPAGHTGRCRTCVRERRGEPRGGGDGRGSSAGDENPRDGAGTGARGAGGLRGLGAGVSRGVAGGGQRSGPGRAGFVRSEGLMQELTVRGGESPSCFNGCGKSRQNCQSH